MTRDELRQIAANDDDPRSSDLARGTPGEPIFRHWLGASQKPPSPTGNSVSSERSSSRENND